MVSSGEACGLLCSPPLVAVVSLESKNTCQGRASQALWDVVEEFLDGSQKENPQIRIAISGGSNITGMIIHIITPKK